MDINLELDYTHYNTEFVTDFWLLESLGFFLLEDGTGCWRLE